MLHHMHIFDFLLRKIHSQFLAINCPYPWTTSGASDLALAVLSLTPTQKKPTNVTLNGPSHHFEVTIRSCDDGDDSF